MSCTQSRIEFDTSALDLLTEDPQWILANEEEFWSTFRAQALTRRWAQLVSRPIDYPAWRRQVGEWAELPLEARRGHFIAVNSRRIVDAAATFQERALPHICEFAPAGTDLSAEIRFTAFVPPRAFAVEDIVFNLSAAYWRGNPDNILNQIVHEIGHVAHSRCRELADRRDLANPNLDSALGNLQAEGYCSYIAYTARPLFPAPDDVDFHLADDPSAVERLFGDLNELLAVARTVPEADFAAASWDKGVAGRAYYVPGLHMCRLIDERLGRKALVGVVCQGLTEFVALYNSLDPVKPLQPVKV